MTKQPSMKQIIPKDRIISKIVGVQPMVFVESVSSNNVAQALIPPPRLFLFMADLDYGYQQLLRH
jgi:hypothetical protein